MKKKTLQALKWGVIRLPELIAGAALIFAITLTTINAFTRYFLHYTIQGSDEYNIIAFAWMVFPGAAAAYRRKMHYGIDLVVNLLPHRVKVIIELLVLIISTVLMFILTHLSVVLFQNVGTKIMTATRISYKVFDASMVVGFGLMAIYSVIFLVQGIRELPEKWRKQTKEEET